MTLIVALKLWKTVAVIADCRVSYLPPYEEVDDYLQKIYQIGDRVVMGFSGPLQGAYEVMELVRVNASRYSSTPVADNLRRDLERWIRYKCRRLGADDRKDLSFVIATVEPKREKRFRWLLSNGQEKAKPSWFPYVPEWSIFTLKPSQSRPGELVREQRPFIKITGINRQDHREAIEKVLMDAYGFSFKQPMPQVRVIMGLLKAEILKRQIRNVGGLFQSALLNEKGIQWLGYSGGNFVLEWKQGRFVQRDNVTGKMLPIMTIWEWAENRPVPGSFGRFEDLDMQEAIEKTRRAADRQ